MVVGVTEKCVYEREPAWNSVRFLSFLTHFWLTICNEVCQGQGGFQRITIEPFNCAVMVTSTKQPFFSFLITLHGSGERGSASVILAALSSCYTCVTRDYLLLSNPATRSGQFYSLETNTSNNHHFKIHSQADLHCRPTLLYFKESESVNTLVN